MNEPMITTWIREGNPDRAERTQSIWRFVRHFCGVMRRFDGQHPLTVGVHVAENLAEIGPDVDVLSFHDYSPDRAAIRAHIERGVGFARELQKPILLSETACLARANPYDVALEVCQDVGIGWYLWELMIGESRWRDIHGVVYPDGTIRDPSIPAAIQGFFRKRHGAVVVPDIDKEGAAILASRRASAWLDAEEQDYAEGLRILERMANLLEAGELVPMNDLPSAKVLRLGSETDGSRAELCRLMVQWNEELSRHTHGDHNRGGAEAPTP